MRPPAAALLLLLAAAPASLARRRRWAGVSGASRDGSGAAVAAAAPRYRLLVAHLHEHGVGGAAERRNVHALWATMQPELERWSLRCLLVSGSSSLADEHVFDSSASSPCPSLALRLPARARGGEGVPDLSRGLTVQGLLFWLARQLQLAPSASVLPFDFLLKLEASTAACYSMLTGLVEAAARRFGGPRRIYLGQLESCTRVAHEGRLSHGDEVADPRRARTRALDLQP
jgi:hypothetical protein